MIRVPTGTKGLDEMLGGGFPKGRVILLCGGPGTGKTIFSLQCLTSSAEKSIPCVYVTLEEPVDLIRENAEAFSWNLRDHEKNNRLRLLDFCTMAYGDASESRYRHGEDSTLSIIRDITNAVKAIDAEQVVIDPLTTLTIREQRAGVKRQKIAEFFRKLRSIRCTSILTLETLSSDREFYMEEFLSDGVIRLDKIIHNFNLIKTIRIEKMRGVKYDEQPRRYIIGEEGFTVYSTEPIVLGERE